MPKSETVWFEEIDRGLINLLKKIKVPIRGVLSSVYVDIKKSDEDFKIDTYPSISIYAQTYSIDKARESTLREEIVEVDTERNIGKLEKAPIPYKFTYKISLWSKNQTQMNYMSRMLHSLVGHFYNLEVHDVSGNPTTCYMELKNPISKGDILTDNSRILQQVFTYEIWTYINEHMQEDVNVVGSKSIQIDMNESGG